MSPSSMDEVWELAHDSRSQKIPVQAQLLSVNLKSGFKKNTKPRKKDKLSC